jgi:hypothetical protein
MEVIIFFVKKRHVILFVFEITEKSKSASSTSLSGLEYK